MSRAEELTLKIIDGTASLQDIDELEWVIASDDKEQQKHIALLRIEALLRGQRQGLDLAPATMAALEKALAERKRGARAVDPIAAMAQSTQEAGIDERGARQATLQRKRRRRKNTPVMLYVMFFLAIALVGAGFAYHQYMLREQRQPIDQAAVSAFTGSVTIVRDTGPKIAQVGSPLIPGNVIRTGENTTVTAHYDELTRFDLKSRSEAQLALPSTPGVVDRALYLGRGEMDVSVVDHTKSPAIITKTPHALITTQGARYAVKVLKSRTRVEVIAGVVKVTSLGSNESLQVGTNLGTVVQAGIPLVARPLDAVDRVTKDLIAIYRFNEGAGNVIKDISRVGTPMNLRIADEGAVRWGNRSLNIAQPTRIRTEGPATKLITMIRNTGAFTIELWINPNDLQQVAPLVSLPSPDDPGWVNFYLGQGLVDGETTDGSRVVSRLRTTNTGPEGLPELRSDAETLSAELVQLVWTKAADGKATYYLNGQPIKEDRQGGAFATWAPNFPLLIANNIDGTQPWLGEIRLLAFYNSALSDKDVELNYNVGLTGELMVIAPDKDTTPKPGSWSKEAYYARFAGELRTPEFTIDSGPARIRYRIKQTRDAPGEVYIRLQSADNPDVVEDVIKTTGKKVGVYVPKNGPGLYRLIINAPENFEGELWVEQIQN